MLSKTELNKLSKARNCLCEYYNKKCFTSENGKCPMTKYYCYDYPTISAMYGSFSNRTVANKAIDYLTKHAEKLGYVAE